MADVLEAMGFPSEWCERALMNASGIETAIDLLLQWQAHGMPQFLSSSVRPSSPPPSSSAGRCVPPHQRQSNSWSLPSAGPTLRLHPFPSTSKSAVVDARKQSPSSTLAPSTSSTCPSSLDGLSGVNNPCNSDSRSLSLPKDPRRSPGTKRNVPHGRIGGPSETSIAADQMAVTGKSGVEGTSPGPEGGSSSTRKIDNLDGSDAVVPDAFAEERKVRYLAARRAKQAREDEKAKIRRHMQEDMAVRRLRHAYQSAPVVERLKASLPVDQRELAGMSRAVSMETMVELQIRGPANQNMKASFPAGARLKDVRLYVENQLQDPLRVLVSPDHHPVLRAEPSPFTGRSTRLASDRRAERELLQTARENFEAHTSRIMATAKSLRPVTSNISSGQSERVMYFLIPFPRQEFFTESAMETTLADAQLLLRGTLVVRFRSTEMEQAGRNDSGTKGDKPIEDGGRSPSGRPHRPVETPVCTLGEVGRFQAIGVEPDGGSSGHPNFEEPTFDPALNGAVKSGRTLEMDGERVRVRELALQAAARRMTEAARIFREGLPLEEGEIGAGFHFPTGTEHHDIADVVFPRIRIPLTQQVAIVLDSVTLPGESHNAKAAPAAAELCNALNHSDNYSPESNEPEKRPCDRALDSLHRQSMAAAEARIGSSQSQSSVVRASCKPEPVEAESRNREDEPESHLVKGRARIPQSPCLLLRPGKLQRTSECSPPIVSPISRDILPNWGGRMVQGSSTQQQLSGGVLSGRLLEAALMRFKATNEANNKGKRMAEGPGSSQVAIPSSSIRLDMERTSLLRVRLEDGNVVLHVLPASTLLQSVRDLVVPEGAIVSAYGFVVPFPEPHFVEGQALNASLEEVGLVPRGTIHLTKSATRGTVRQGRRMSCRRQNVEDSDNDLDEMGIIFNRFSEHISNRADLTYEQLMELEESIGRVHVGVPEEILTTLPTYIVKVNKVEAVTSEGMTAGNEDLDLCIVCMAEMLDGEEALSLPCVHAFHTLCIRQWLLQSTCCPTCKFSLV